MQGKGFVCSCFKGFGLVKFNVSLITTDESPVASNSSTDLRRHTCVDIDECQSFNSHCPQGCVNEKGSYKCQCAANYVDPHGDGTICEATASEDAVVLIAYGDEIRQVRQNISDFVYSTLVEDEKSVIALDIDAYDRHGYWIDEYDKLIRRSYIPVSKASLARTQNLNAFRTSSEQDLTALSIDWLAKNLYYADSVSKTIKVSTADGRYIKTLVKENANYVTSLAVNPIVG